jgi:hypothetical protein
VTTRPAREAAVSRVAPDHTIEPTLTARRLAAVAGLSVRSIYSAVERGDIPSVRVGRRVIIPTREALVAVGLLSAEAPQRSGVAVPAEVVARIARYRGAGLSSAMIARALAADNVPGPGGEPWTTGAVEAVGDLPTAHAV